MDLKNNKNKDINILIDESFFTVEAEPIKIFSVKKEEYPEVYNLVSEMLQNIENNKYLDLGNGKNIIKEEYSSFGYAKAKKGAARTSKAIIT